VVIAKSSTNSRESHNAQRIVISPLRFPCQNLNGGNVRLVITLSASLVVRPGLPRPISRGGFPLGAAVALGVVRPSVTKHGAVITLLGVVRWGSR
jgi:hypothetical protein